MQVILALSHMRSCMTVYDKALNTKLYKLELLTDDVYKMDSTANPF